MAHDVKIAGRGVGLALHDDGELTEQQKELRSSYSHDFGERPELDRECCMDSYRQSPSRRQEKVRTHAQIESAHRKDPDLNEGLSMRAPLTGMGKAIDDGVEP